MDHHFFFQHYPAMQMWVDVSGFTNVHNICCRALSLFNQLPAWLTRNTLWRARACFNCASSVVFGIARLSVGPPIWSGLKYLTTGWIAVTFYTGTYFSPEDYLDRLQHCIMLLETLFINIFMYNFKFCFLQTQFKSYMIFKEIFIYVYIKRS